MQHASGELNPIETDEKFERVMEIQAYLRRHARDAHLIRIKAATEHVD